MRFARRRRTSRYPRVWNLILMWNAPSGNSPNVIQPGISTLPLFVLLSPLWWSVFFVLIVILWTSLAHHVSLIDDLWHCPFFFFGTLIFLRCWTVFPRSVLSHLNFLLIFVVLKHRIMGGQHPLLQKVAIRLFEVCPQSASVERVCKAEGVIHTEMRWRLSNVTVQMLLYLYVNLRVSWTNWQVNWAISLLMPCVIRIVMNLRK